MDIAGIAYVGYELGILVGGLGVCPFAGDVIYSFAVLPLVAGDHVDRLLEQVEIEILVGK